MNASFWTLRNGTWFIYNGQTFLKLHGGPKAKVYCLDTKQIIVFKQQNIKVLVST